MKLYSLIPNCYYWSFTNVFIFYTHLVQFRIKGDGAYSSCHWVSGGVHPRQAAIHTHDALIVGSILALRIILTCLFLDSGRKLEHKERIHTHREYMQTPHRKALARNQMMNPPAVRQGLGLGLGLTLTPQHHCAVPCVLLFVAA